MTSLFDQYNWFTNGAVVGGLGRRTLIEIAGADRVKFLHNYCTADVQKLNPGAGAEAFVTSVKGKVLGHVFIDGGDDRLWLETAPGQAENLLAHLDRYIIADDVQLRDASADWAFVYVGGMQAEALLESLTDKALPQRTLEFTSANFNGMEVIVRRGGAVGESGFVLRGRADDVQTLTTLLKNAGAQAVGAEFLDVLRVEAGMPRYGVDITDDNLPQEVNRNAQAISFTKGCYLGQETVARLDALGHVNKLLVGVKFAGPDAPPSGEELTAEGKRIGKVTSAVFSPRLSAPLALAYVRTEHSAPGAPLTSAYGKAEVVVLPLR